MPYRAGLLVLMRSNGRAQLTEKQPKEAPISRVRGSAAVPLLGCMIRQLYCTSEFGGAS